MLNTTLFESVDQLTSPSDKPRIIKLELHQHGLVTWEYVRKLNALVSRILNLYNYQNKITVYTNNYW